MLLFAPKERNTYRTARFFLFVLLYERDVLSGVALLTERQQIDKSESINISTYGADVGLTAHLAAKPGNTGKLGAPIHDLRFTIY